MQDFVHQQDLNRSRTIPGGYVRTFALELVESWVNESTDRLLLDR